MRTIHNTQLSPAQHYQLRVDRRMNNIHAQREKQRRQEKINNLIFIGLGTIFALGVLFILVQNGNMIGGSNGFSGSFEKLLNR